MFKYGLSSATAGNPVCNAVARRMSGFDSLTWALDGWFETALCDLPEVLRQRVEREFLPMPWDQLSAAERRYLALQWDRSHDPAMAETHQFWWDFDQQILALKKQITDWEATAAPTATDLAMKESRLKDLGRELARMELQQREATDDYEPACARLGAGGQASALVASTVRYVAYPKAMAQLRKRLDATPEELAAWTWAGPKHGGLAAYVNANELEPPPRFYFGLGTGRGDDQDYVARMMWCWFREDEIAAFMPADRYITGEALINRWGERPGLRAEAWVRAKIQESRLSDLHPIYGFTQGTAGRDADYPPLASGLFKLSEVQAVEANDFADEDVQSTLAANAAPTVEGEALNFGPAITEVSEAGSATLLLPTAATGLPFDAVEKKPEHSDQASKLADGIRVVSNETSTVQTPPAELTVGSPEWRKRVARAAADAKHSKPGGSREKQAEIRNLWASGKYSDRSACAEQECEALGMAFTTARKALTNTPDPVRN